jgi:hypothetical protein
MRFCLTFVCVWSDSSVTLSQSRLSPKKKSDTSPTQKSRESLGTRSRVTLLRKKFKKQERASYFKHTGESISLIVVRSCIKTSSTSNNPIIIYYNNTYRVLVRYVRYTSVTTVASVTLSLNVRLCLTNIDLVVFPPTHTRLRIST